MRWLAGYALEGARRVGALPPVAAACTVLLYHRVCPPADAATLDAELVIAPAVFAQQMAELRARCNPLSLAQLQAALEGDAPLPPRAVLVTFDDGYRDLYDHALPALEANGVPAVVFVTTGFIQGEVTFWWDELGLALRHATVEALELPMLERRQALTSAAQKRAAYRALEKILYPRDTAAQRQILGAVWQAAKPAPRAREALSQRFALSWEQMRAMGAAGIAFGAHTRTHPSLGRVLSALTPDTRASWLESELESPRVALEAALQQPVTAFAYPYGLAADWLDDARLANAGYQLAFTSRPGLVRAASARWRLPRQFVVASDPRVLFRVKCDGTLPALHETLRERWGIALTE